MRKVIYMVSHSWEGLGEVLAFDQWVLKGKDDKQ